MNLRRFVALAPRDRRRPAGGAGHRRGARRQRRPGLRRRGRARMRRAGAVVDGAEEARLSGAGRAGRHSRGGRHRRRSRRRQRRAGAGRPRHLRRPATPPDRAGDHPAARAAAPGRARRQRRAVAEAVERALAAAPVLRAERAEPLPGRRGGAGHRPAPYGAHPLSAPHHPLLHARARPRPRTSSRSSAGCRANRSSGSPRSRRKRLEMVPLAGADPASTDRRARPAAGDVLRFRVARRLRLRPDPERRSETPIR